MLSVLSKCSLSAYCMLTECSLSAHLLLTYPWLIAWRFEPEWWKLTALDKHETNGRTQIVTPWAPDGDQKEGLKERLLYPKKREIKSASIIYLSTNTKLIFHLFVLQCFTDYIIEYYSDMYPTQFTADKGQIYVRKAFGYTPFFTFNSCFPRRGNVQLRTLRSSADGGAASNSMAGSCQDVFHFIIYLEWG